jgi:hypothetical protein
VEKGFNGVEFSLYRTSDVISDKIRNYVAHCGTTMKAACLLLALTTMLLSGCAQYDNEAMAGGAVDMEKSTPLQPVTPAAEPAYDENGQPVPER